MKEYYTGNIYKTPEGHKSSVWDFILLRSRLYFYLKVITNIIKYNFKFARKGLYTPEIWARESNDILRIAEASGGKVEITGIDNIRKLKGEPVVFVGNHMGLLETLILPSIIDPINTMTFVVKSSLVEMPLLGKIIGSTNPIVVGRENPREDLMKVISEGIYNLRNNISVLLFPQSTRQQFLDRKKFNSLGVKLALRGNVRIVPLALKTDFVEQGKLIKDIGKLNREKTVYIKFGEPLKIEGNGKAEHEVIIEFISENLKKWGGKVQ